MPSKRASLSFFPTCLLVHTQREDENTSKRRTKGAARDGGGGKRQKQQEEIEKEMRVVVVLLLLLLAAAEEEQQQERNSRQDSKPPGRSHGARQTPKGYNFLRTQLGTGAGPQLRGALAPPTRFPPPAPCQEDLSLPEQHVTWRDARQHDSRGTGKTRCKLQGQERPNGLIGQQQRSGLSAALT
eukprot:768606-Hanusia_phi.AAC.3